MCCGFGSVGIFRKVLQVRRHLVVEFDQDHRAMNAVVEDAAGFGAPNPRKPGVLQMAADFLHLHPRVPVVHVVDVQRDEARQLLPLRLRQL